MVVIHSVKDSSKTTEKIYRLEWSVELTGDGRPQFIIKDLGSPNFWNIAVLNEAGELAMYNHITAIPGLKITPTGSLKTVPLLY